MHATYLLSKSAPALFRREAASKCFQNRLRVRSCFVTRLLSSTRVLCRDEVEAAESFVMPKYKKNEDIETTPRAEALFQDILKLQPNEVPIIGHILMHRLEISPDEMMMMINSRLGIGFGGVAAPSADGGNGEAAEVNEENLLFDLKLTGFDAKSKIKVIKEVRSIAELGLKEAKELVEGAPKVIKKAMKKDDAEALKESLEKVGATVEIS